MSREMFLNKADSLGYFNFIRLLYDDYLFILIEHRCANVTGLTPVAVMSKVRLKNLYLSVNNFNFINNQETFPEWSNLMMIIKILISFLLKLGKDCCYITSTYFNCY